MDNLNTPSAKEVWSKVVESLQRELSPQVYERWLIPIQPLEIVEDELMLGVPDDFFKSWIIDHYGSIISLSLKEHFSRPSRFQFTTYEQKELPASVSTPASSPQQAHIARQTQVLSDYS